MINLMSQKPKETEQKLSDDLKTFEELPTRTQDSLLLGDEMEKSTGKARASIHREIKSQPAPAKP